MSVSDKVKFNVVGHLKLQGRQDGKIIREESNSIHPENLARIFARALANENYHSIYALHLGNGGSFIDSASRITYNSPNTTGVDAKLYNRTYSEIVDGTGPIDNSVISSAGPGDLTSLVTITAVISSDEPNDQNPTDSADALNLANPPDESAIPYGASTNFGYKYSFDEIALVAKDPTLDNSNPDNHILLTHLVFNPIEKSANRELLLTYTLTISVS